MFPHLTTDVWIVVWAIVLVTMMLFGFFARLYRKAGPNEALVVFGIRGPRVVKGNGTVIFLLLENCRELSLEVMSFDVAPQQGRGGGRGGAGAGGAGARGGGGAGRRAI